MTPSPSSTPREYSVSIIIPCRNEKGNIEAVVTRMPEFSSCQELIFVEGHSVDGTYEEILRVMKAYPEKDIKLFRQEGEGKGDAVRLGFTRAGGEVLVIFDADVTVGPESLPAFYAALRDHRGEFVYGSRLVLPMEKGAMPCLNLWGNRISALFFSWRSGRWLRNWRSDSHLRRCRYAWAGSRRSFWSWNQSKFLVR